MAKTQLTKEGLKVLEEELRVLVETKRPKLVERLAIARGHGDLSENNDYQTAKEELEFLDGRIAELEEVLKNVEVVKTKNGKKSLVEVGTKVLVKVDGHKQMYYIVGDWEADPKEKKISHTSPLGKALVGKKVGEKIEVEAPVGKLTYEILTIE